MEPRDTIGVQKRGGGSVTFVYSVRFAWSTTHVNHFHLSENDQAGDSVSFPGWGKAVKYFNPSLVPKRATDTRLHRRVSEFGVEEIVAPV